MGSFDPIISMFIDDELSLDEKQEFVERVHASRDFKDETIALLSQEKKLRSEVVEHVPDLKSAIVHMRPRVFSMVRPLVVSTAVIVAAVLVFTFVLVFKLDSATASHRFVIYKPDASQVEIAGSFTGWRKVPLERKGSSGYWEITMKIPEGEHRFTYVLDDRAGFADPTIPMRERDDFGGENSILLAGADT